MSKSHVVVITQHVPDAMHVSPYRRTRGSNRFSCSPTMSTPRMRLHIPPDKASSALTTCFNIPRTRPKHLSCSSCNRKFCIPAYNLVADKMLLTGPLIPLLLPCGHSICSGCVKRKAISCSSCKISTENYDIEKLPLNLYVLGLLVSSCQRPLENDDHDFAFHAASRMRPLQIKNQGYCHECGNSASVKCVQCVALFCSSCYSRMHRRALQKHTQISLVTEGGDFNEISMYCSPPCFEELSHFCNDCDVSGCSSCMLEEHKNHNLVKLQEKNEDMLSEFNKVKWKIAENLHRVGQTRQKLKSTLTSMYKYEEECDAVEKTINQHFARLHGILQNLEARLMDQVYQRPKNLKNNLTTIEQQLHEEEEQLRLAAMRASLASNKLGKVDIRQATKILNAMIDLPCHLVRNDIAENETILSTVDESIIAILENHYIIEVPKAPYYQLVRTEVLPKDHEIEPLADFCIEDVFEQILPSKPIRSLSIASLATNESTVTMQSIKQAEKTHENTVNKHQIELAHVHNPSLFFVRYLASKAEFVQLEKDLRAYAETCDEKSSAELNQDDACIVKDSIKDNWYRGRVDKIDVNANDSSKILYDIFCIDYGYKQHFVPISRIRSISDEHLILQPQAIKCCLYGVSPKKNTWTAKSTKEFIKLLRGTSIFMYIKKQEIHQDSEIMHVDLCTDSSGSNMGPQSICNAMIFMNLACNDNPTTEIHDSTCVYTKEELILNKTIDVTVTHVESPFEIYVSKQGVQKIELSKLLDKLKEYYESSTLTAIISTPREGLPCVALHTDGVWHRCEITKIIPKDKVEVFYVDIGRTSVLDCCALRTIPYTYTQYKAQAIRVALSYVNPESDGKWKPESVDTLRSIFDDVTSIKVVPRKKTNYGYRACISAGDILDVSRFLKSKGLVEPWNFKKLPKKTVQRNIDIQESFDSSLKELSSEEEPEYDTILVKEEESTKDPFKMQVNIKRVVTPYCIYVAQSDYEESNTNLIAAMQQFYNSYCSESRDNWSENALCAVYSPKDKSYLRARILEIKSPAEVLVYFCDMGIDETIPMKNLQVLHPKFVKQPAHCFKVRLAGILPCGGSSAWPSLSCSTLIDIVHTNMRCKFFITKLVGQEICDNSVSVELWVRQVKIPGPLAPSKVEINSINRMLVEAGVALPIKDYFSKVDSVLTTEFKRQLLNSHKFSCEEEDNIKWRNIDPCAFVGCKEDDSVTLGENDFDQTYSLKTKHERPSHWLPPEEITEEVFHALPTYVDDKGFVYLYSTKQNGHTIHAIDQELQACFASKEIKTWKHWKEGDICIARYHRDGKWYRGRVVQVNGNLLQVEFVDYGNIEEIDIAYVTRDIKMEHTPIQCTKCLVSGLSPNTSSGKWTLHGLDVLHFILVEKSCKVTVLQRQPTHLVVSIKVLTDNPARNLLTIFSGYEFKDDIEVKIEPLEWNNKAINLNEGEDSTTDSSKNITVLKEITSHDEMVDTLQQSLSELEVSQNVIIESAFEENVISGNLSKPEYSGDKEVADFDNISLPNTDDDVVICSTPQNQSGEENFFGVYKPLNIPPETEFIEVILRCNKDPVTSYAQLAENNDDIFSDVLHDYYLQYEAITLDIQENASSQPLIESFENSTSCIAQFTDDQWYRCVITQCRKIGNSQRMRVILHYIDYGNNEYKDISIESNDLRVPKKEWMELPAMAFECQLYNIGFGSNDINLLAGKLDEIYNKVVVARVMDIHEDMLIAEIYEDKMCQNLLYAHLIEEGLYQQKKPKED